MEEWTKWEQWRRVEEEEEKKTWGRGNSPMAH